MKIKLSAFAGLVLLLLIIKGCSTQVCGCVYPTMVEIGFTFEDQEGKDLLNPNHEYAFDRYDPQFSYQTEQSEESLTYGMDYEITETKSGNKYIDLVLGSKAFVNKNATVFIDFENASRDTLKVKADNSQETLFATKIWYNQELIWDKNSGDVKQFEITKTITPPNF